METMINLTDLLKHEILDLYSAEEQIIEAMPAMIEKAKNPELKRALQQHLKITEEQKNRLDKVKQMFGSDGEESSGENGEGGGEKRGFFSRLFGGGSGGGEKCRGMEGLITEGNKFITSDDISDEALDSAIIASAQKIEHYEICGYGTARAFARELNLPEVERLLAQTLEEEYTSDDLLTSLAVGRVNQEAEQATDMEGGGGRRNGGSRGGSNSSKGGSKSGGSKGSSKGGSSKGGSSKGSNSSKGGSSKGGSKNGGSKGGNSKGSNSSKSGSSKGGSSKGSNSSKGGSSKGGSKGGNSKGSNSSKSGSSKGGSSKGSNSSKGGSSKGGSKGGGSKGGSSKGGSKGGSSKGGSKGGSRR